MFSTWPSFVHAQDEIATLQSGYRVMSGDVLSVLVYGEDDLSGKYNVGTGGEIVFPLVGTLMVKGLTADDVRATLHQKLTEGYLVNPNITVSIASHRPFYILGEVRAPGSYSYAPDMSVLNAVALAGGFTYRADRKEAEIVRSGQEQTSENREDISMEVQINPGDIIFIKERFF